MSQDLTTKRVKLSSRLTAKETPLGAALHQAVEDFPKEVEIICCNSLVETNMCSYQISRERVAVKRV
jgi:hypothetical protein